MLWLAPADFEDLRLLVPFTWFAASVTKLNTTLYTNKSKPAPYYITPCYVVHSLNMAYLKFAMWKLLLFLTTLSTIASSCVPPFNDLRYLDNTALLEEAVAQFEANPVATGRDHVLGGTSPVRQWPTNSNCIVEIKYCYANEDAKSKLKPAVEDGWRMWYNLLGNGGPGKGHRLGGFSEMTKGGNSLFCWSDGTGVIKGL